MSVHLWGKQQRLQTGQHLLMLGRQGAGVLMHQIPVAALWGQQGLVPGPLVEHLGACSLSGLVGRGLSRGLAVPLPSCHPWAQGAHCYAAAAAHAAAAAGMAAGLRAVLPAVQVAVRAAVRPFGGLMLPCLQQRRTGWRQWLPVGQLAHVTQAERL